jgi:hypothetical protein
MEILFNIQPTLPSKSEIVPDLSEHDCTFGLVLTKFKIIVENGND